jgi:hypothetical protein
MNGVNTKKADRKQKLIHELVEYWINVAYLSFFFGVFITYRRLILAEYHIPYGDYGIALIKALVLAKVIMIGDLLRLGRGLENRPLIFPTLYKTVIFTLWVVLFGVVESLIRGLLHGKGLAGGFDELMSKGIYELLAGCLVIFFAFIPFFAFKELERVLGEGKIRELFIRRNTGRHLQLHE